MSYDNNYDVDNVADQMNDMQLEQEGGWTQMSDDVKTHDESRAPNSKPVTDYTIEKVVSFNNFADLLRTHAAQQCTRSEPNFECGGIEWRLMMFPRGLTRRPGFIGVFLEAADWRQFGAKGEQHVECTISLINHLDSARNTQQKFTQVFHSACCDQGFDNVLQLHGLNEQSGFVKNGTISFLVKLELPNPNQKWGKLGKEWDSRKETGLVGLVNQGATCYMSALLQNLYHNSHLRRAVYQMPIVDATHRARSIPWQMQRLFYELQTCAKAPETKGLTHSFGWTEQDAYKQHDIQEFARVLQDKLEEKMKGSPVDGTMKQLFVGLQQSYIQCVNIDYVSKRNEDFYDLSMGVKGFPTLLKSFENYIEVEEMKGDNQYRADGHGLQDARKGVRFLKFPPVLQLQLKRFEYDMYQDQMVKVNDRFEFPTELDLSAFVADDADADRTHAAVYILQSVLVHVGGVHGGHYYMFVRPSATSDQWFKIDDETVTAVTEKEAVQDNYGGPQPSLYPSVGGGALQKLNSAYMLSYVRKADAEALLRPIADDEVPAAVIEGIKEEDALRAEEEKERRRQALMTKVDVLLERDLVAGAPNLNEMGGGKVPLRQFQIEKFKTLADLSLVIEKEVGIPVANQAFFRVVKRENKCVRPNSAVPTAQFQTRMFGPIDHHVTAHMQVPIGQAVWHNYELNVFYLVELPNANQDGAASVQCGTASTYQHDIVAMATPEQSPDKVMVSFKFFDVRSQRLEFVGSRIIKRNVSIEQLRPMLIEMTNGRLAANTPLRLFEEDKAPAKLPEYRADDSLAIKNVVTGDIFCFCESLAPAELDAIQDAWHAEQRRIVGEKRAANAEARARSKAADDAKRLAELSWSPEERKEAEAAAKKAKEAAKKSSEAEDKKAESTIVPARPLFHPTPDSLLRALFNVMRVRMERRESDPVSFFFMELYRDRSVIEAIEAIAEHLGEEHDHVRLFAMNSQRQYLLDNYVTNTTAGLLSEYVSYHAMFVYETLDHSVDLLKTHMQANVTWCSGNGNGTLSIVRPMCPKDGDLRAVFVEVQKMLISQGINVAADARVRALEIESYAVKHVLPLETPATQVWDWHQGYSNPRKNIRMECVPADELDADPSAVVWCHSFAPAASIAYFPQPFGVPFSMVLRARETAIEFRQRVGACLGESPDAVKRSWKVCQCSAGVGRYDPIPDDAILAELVFPPLLRWQRDASPSALPAIGIQRPNNRVRGVIVDQSIKINEAKD